MMRCVIRVDRGELIWRGVLGFVLFFMKVARFGVFERSHVSITGFFVVFGDDDLGANRVCGSSSVESFGLLGGRGDALRRTSDSDEATWWRGGGGPSRGRPRV